MNSNSNELFYQPSSTSNPEILLHPAELVGNNPLEFMMDQDIETIEISHHVSQICQDIGLPSNALETAARATGIYEPPQRQVRADEPLMVQRTNPMLADPVDPEWGDIAPRDLLPTHLPTVSNLSIRSNSFDNIFQRPPKRIVYPDHPKKTNGISYLGYDGSLFATHRMLKSIRVPFGLENMCRSDDPHARIGVYLSMPGVFDPIKNCAKHAAEFKTDQMMALYYKGEDVEVNMERIEGFDVLTAPILPTIGDDNNRTYALEFSCHTSCQTKHHGRGKTLTLNYVIVKNGKILSLIHKCPLYITANPGRDCDKKAEKKTGKRKSDESVTSSIPVKREHIEELPHRFIDQTPMISAAAHDLFDAQLPVTMTDEQRRVFMVEQNAIIRALLTTAVDNAKRAHQG